MRRIVSVWLKNFPLDCLAWRAHLSNRNNRSGPPPDARSPTTSTISEPFALVRSEAHGLRISAVNASAWQSGIRQDMRLSDARALLPSLATQPATPEADARVLCRLADWCQRYTPITNTDGSDGLWLDIAGAAHLFGGEDALLADLDQRLSRIGFAHGLGLADTPGAAWAMARFASSNTQTISTGHLAEALDSLPLEALRLDDEILYLLKRFGLKTIGALRELPRSSLKRRFPSSEDCEAVLQRLDQVFGRVMEPIVPLRPAPAYYERLPCPEPILETDSFHHGLHELLERLVKRMERDRKGATRLTLSAYHADGGVSRTTVATARPSRDTRHLAHLFRDQIEKINPGFGVDVLVLYSDATETLEAEQISLSSYARQACDHDDVTHLIDRLSNRLGAENVQRALPRESHIPEFSEQRISALRRNQSVEIFSSKPLRPFRLLDRPEAIQVMAEVPEGPPMRFTWRRVMHRVISAEGPERIAPEWWHLPNATVLPPRTRDYYRVEDEQGQRFWLFREGLYRDADKTRLPTWHLHGVFA